MLMIYQLIMAAAGLFALTRMMQLDHRLLRYTLGMQVTGIILSFLDSASAATGFQLFYIGALLFMLYGLFVKSLPRDKKYVIISMALPVFLHGMFVIFHLPNVYVLQWAQVIALLLYFVLVISKRRAYKQELGSLTILAASALIQVITAIMYAMQS